MSKLVLEAQPRDAQAGKAKHLRHQGLIPVVVYGKGQQTISLAIPERGIETTLRQGGTSQLIEVRTAGGPATNVLVREVQRDPINHRLLHVDLYAVRMDEKQHVSVPVSGVGKPEALASGLMVLQNLETVAIEALPAAIPAFIEIDLTALSVENPILVRDLPAIEGISYISDPGEHVFSMVATRAGVEEEEEVEEVEEEGAEPEVVRRGREDEEEE